MSTALHHRFIAIAVRNKRSRMELLQDNNCALLLKGKRKIDGVS